MWFIVPVVLLNVLAVLLTFMVALIVAPLIMIQQLTLTMVRAWLWLKGVWTSMHTTITSMLTLTIPWHACMRRIV